MGISFKALVVEETDHGEFIRSVREKTVAELPDGDVLVKVSYSSLNYKDALSASGNKGVTSNYPHTPGIDAAGIVSKSSDKRFKAGDEVIVTSYDLGQNTDGGFGGYIRVPSEWVVPLPDGISLRESMILGTAGFTAALGVHHLQSNNLHPGSGPVLVTGATGGVGTMAISILSKTGYSVVSATGKKEEHHFLEKLGSKKVIHRDEVQNISKKPLLTSKWAGAIDTVGGNMLDTVIRQTGHNGTVACCGNVLGHRLHTSVYPFILRGVSLMGIDSGNCPMPLRKKIWELLGGDWKPEKLDELYRECALEDLDAEIGRTLKGKQVGRILVNPEA